MASFAIMSLRLGVAPSGLLDLNFKALGLEVWTGPLSLCSISSLIGELAESLGLLVILARLSADALDPMISL